MGLFVMLYVWQNIEVIRIEMECGRLGRIEHELREEHNRLRAGVESLLRRDILESEGSVRGYRLITPADLDVVRFEDKKSGQEISHR